MARRGHISIMKWFLRPRCVRESTCMVLRLHTSHTPLSTHRTCQRERRCTHVPTHRANPTFCTPHIAQVDNDHSGEIDLEELTAAMEAMNMDLNVLKPEELMSKVLRAALEAMGMHVALVITVQLTTGATANQRDLNFYPGHKCMID